VTGLLHRWREGDQSAFQDLLPLVYAELRRLAQRYLRRERPGHTLQPTALVHEAYLRMAGAGHSPAWNDRVHFYAVSAQLMRQVLVDHARSRGAAKRGGGVVKVSLDEDHDQDVLAHVGLDGGSSGGSPTDLLALDAALRELEAIDLRKSRIIELRFFGGLSIEETAQMLGVSVPLVVKETRIARAFLHDAMTGGGGDADR
jgi:RNA polymerase sigma factor (TIGR02999 family)